MNQRGHTLVELMIALTALTPFLAVLCSAATRLHRSERHAAACADDVMQCERALTRLEADLREAAGVEWHRNALRISQPDRVVDYRLEQGALLRRESSVDRIVARHVATLTAVRDGELVRLRVEMRSRAEPARRAPAVSSTVWLRNGERP